ncbi:MAG: hypothetical protein NT126_10880 [Bacteroidetes bacterium]|nr:hypothetical protein [Bacteroidota bacterium]
MKTLLFNSAFILGVTLIVSCNQTEQKKETPTQVAQEEIQATKEVVGKPKLLSDTIFIGFQFGMSLKEAQAHVAKLKSKGVKINLTSGDNKMSGTYLLNDGQYSVTSEMTILFMNDKLFELQIKIQDTDEEGHGMVVPGGRTSTKVLNDLADYIATMHGQYKTGEDKDQFDYYFWTDGNRNFKVWQTDWNVKVDRAYHIDFKITNQTVLTNTPVQRSLVRRIACRVTTLQCTIRS